MIQRRRCCTKTRLFIEKRPFLYKYDPFSENTSRFQQNRPFCTKVRLQSRSAVRTFGRPNASNTELEIASAPAQPTTIQIHRRSFGRPNASNTELEIASVLPHPQIHKCMFGRLAFSLRLHCFCHAFALIFDLRLPCFCLCRCLAFVLRSP